MTLRRLAIACITCASVLPAQPLLAQALGLGPGEGAGAFAREVGKRFTFVCPPSDGQNASVYGTDVYTADSAVCAAAIHAGVLKPQSMGAVTIVIGSGAESFTGSTRNGVRTRSYGPWHTSYTFAIDPAPGSITWRTTWTGIPQDFTTPLTLECPAGGAPTGTVWGTGVYTRDSTICTAAVHAGVIQPESGGLVLVQRAAGLERYEGSERNGIASRPWGAYQDAFSIARAEPLARLARPADGIDTSLTPLPLPESTPADVDARAPNDVPTLQRGVPLSEGPSAQGGTLSRLPSPTAAVPTAFVARIVAVAAEGAAVSLSWQPVPDAIAYRLEGPGIPPEGIVVTATTSITINTVPPGPSTWRLAAVYANEFWDPSKMASASAMVRFAPARSSAWLSKYGLGDAGQAITHFLSLCQLCLPGIDWETFLTAFGGLQRNIGICLAGSTGYCEGIPYVNVTDFGTPRATRCSAIQRGILCYSDTDAARSVVVQRDGATGFFAFSKGADGSLTLTDRITMDSEGPKFLPHACLACHGGSYDAANGVVTNSTLLPLDPGLLQVEEVTAAPTIGSRERHYTVAEVNQELIRPLNEGIVEHGAGPAVARHLRGVYGPTLAGPPNLDYVPLGWSSQAGLYRQVVRPYCMMCHLASTSTVDVSSWDAFRQNGQRIHAAVCTERSMPHAEVPFNSFWTKDTGSLFLPGLLAASLGYDRC